MSDKFVVSTNEIGRIIVTDVETGNVYHHDNLSNFLGLIRLLNEQQEFIEELEASDEMGWKRAEYFEKKCPKELHNKKMYIKRLEYKVQKFKEENEQLKKARDESDKFIAKKGLGVEFLNWCVAEAENDE